MKRIVFLIALIFMVSVAAGVFAQDPVQPNIQAPQETKSEVKKADTSKDGTVPFTIGEIVVRDRAVPNIEDASTTTVVDGKDIEQRGDRSLGDSLQQVPGITVAQTAKGFTGFNMRGFDHQKVAILVDGIPVLDPYNGGNNIDISSIPVANVSHIVVNRGVASALYGSLGAVGSINIITKKPERLTAAGKAEYGAHQNYMLSAEAGAPIGNFYAWVSAAYQNSNGYEISEKLDSSERRKWFDKLVQYGTYGQAFPGSLQSTQNYLNDDGVWNHTSYKKYQIDGRVGYNITDKIETGISASYYSNVQESNTFSSTTTVTWNQKGTSWNNDPNFTAEGKSSAFQNRAFSWPEDTKLTVAPYLKADFGDLDIRVNVFYTAQRNNLEGWANQAETLMMFPSSTFNPGTGARYSNDQVQSIYEETAYGFFFFPTYKLAQWNKLSATVHFRVEKHEKYEKAINGTVAAGVVGVHGTGEYITQDMEARYVTLALEDESRFNTGFGMLYVTAGISYDAQDIGTFQQISGVNDGTLNTMVNAFFAESDTMLWGTRDSINPVIALLYDPIKDFLRLRAAGAMKTEFPNLNIYQNITETTDLTIEPERIYTANAGFELFFLNNIISFRSDYFYTRIDDKIESLYFTTGSTAYTNIDGYTVQGVENTFQSKFDRLAGIMNLSVALGYVYTYARSYDDSTFTMGESVERTPVHQVTFQLVMDFITKTRLMLWGNYIMNQIMYVMASDPTPAYAGAFTTDVYTTQKLHNPFMLHVKVQQELPFNTYVYATCKNVLDDYNADPFNPGPGRMFYFGGGGRL